MTPTDQGTGPAVELFVRSLHPRGMAARQHAVVDRLSSLTERGVIDGFEVVVWGDGLALSTPSAGTEPGRRARRAYERFREWAAAGDRSIADAFEPRTTRSELTGEQYHVVGFPALTLAEYVDDELQHVAPCSVGDEPRTVEDRLDALERTGPPTTDGTGDATGLALSVDGGD